MNFWGDEQFSFFESILFQALGQSVQVIEAQFLSGGNINMTAQVFSSEGVFFVKWSHDGHYTHHHELSGPADDDEQDATLPPFEAEARGLDLLRQTDLLLIPQVIGYGEHSGKSYLILEYIDADKPSRAYWENLGQSLAGIHAHTQPDRKSVV